MTEGKSVKPAQMQGAVKAGYNPMGGLKESAVALQMGIGKDRMLEVWQKKVSERKEPWNLCPVCYGKLEPHLQKAKKCFVATAVFASLDAPEVEKLRLFRDRHLMKTPWGRAFTAWYYEAGPAMAAIVDKRPGLKTPLRILLRLVVKATRYL
jgi:hypothetical protein